MIYWSVLSEFLRLPNVKYDKIVWDFCCCGKPSLSLWHIIASCFGKSFYLYSTSLEWLFSLIMFKLLSHWTVINTRGICLHLFESPDFSRVFHDIWLLGIYICLALLMYYYVVPRPTLLISVCLFVCLLIGCMAFRFSSRRHRSPPLKVRRTAILAIRSV